MTDRLRALRVPTGGRARRVAGVTRAALVLLVVMGLAATSCGGSDGDGDQSSTSTSVEPRRGGRIVYMIEAQPIGFNPTSTGWDASGLLVASAIFDPLMAWDADGEVQPYLLESYSHNDDFTEWTFTLRDGIKFHNGDDLDAEALAELTEAHTESLLTGTAAYLIEKVEVIDDLTARLTTSAPWSTYPLLLAGQAGMVAAPAQLNGDNPQTEPIGTGPFILEEWDSSGRIILSRNPDYWQEGLPYLESVEFVTEPDADARLDAVLEGDADATHASDPGVIERASQEGLQVVTDSENTEESFVMLNMDRPPLDDVRVRRAIALATDPAAATAAAGNPDAPLADGPFAPESPWYVDPHWPETDEAAARALVDEYEAEVGPVEFELGTIPVTTNLALGQELIRQWEAVGMEVTTTSVEQADLIVNAAAGNYDALIFRLFNAPDPGADFYWWDSRTALSEGQIALNFARMRDDQVDQALERGRTTDDFEVRAAAYADLQQRLSEIVPYVWLNRVEWGIIYRQGLHDVTSGPMPDGQVSLPQLVGWHRLTHTWTE